MHIIRPGTDNLYQWASTTIWLLGTALSVAFAWWLS
jgi:hypothetical protein